MEVKKLNLYRHFKGELYIILEIGTHTETEEEMVVYTKSPLQRGEKIWIRPLSMFEGKNDKGEPRFTHAGWSCGWL